MILYKYCSLETGLKALENSTIAYSRGSTFNDPTELTAASYDGEEWSRTLFPRHFLLSQHYGICCLTRAPLNAIMWSHYGDQHKGVCIGIDARLAGFDDAVGNVIPAQHGSIIYTASKPTYPYENSEELAVRTGMIKEFSPQWLEALQRAFLYKSSEWAYEEEVRIVRHFSRLVDAEDIYMFTGQNTILSPIPTNAIVSVHIGWRALADDYETAIENMKAIESYVPMASIRHCSFIPATWKMQDTPFDDWKRKIPQWYHGTD